MFRHFRCRQQLDASSAVMHTATVPSGQLVRNRDSQRCAPFLILRMLPSAAESQVARTIPLDLSRTTSLHFRHLVSQNHRHRWGGRVRSADTASQHGALSGDESRGSVPSLLKGDLARKESPPGRVPLRNLLARVLPPSPAPEAALAGRRRRK
jgi:hypothetical protein